MNRSIVFIQNFNKWEILSNTDWMLVASFADLTSPYISELDIKGTITLNLIRDIFCLKKYNVETLTSLHFLLWPTIL